MITMNKDKKKQRASGMNAVFAGLVSAKKKGGLKTEPRATKHVSAIPRRLDEHGRCKVAFSVSLELAKNLREYENLIYFGNDRVLKRAEIRATIVETQLDIIIKDLLEVEKAKQGKVSP